MSHIRQAFDMVCKDAIAAGCWYVSLVEHVQFYGGPEEGGWWGTDTFVIAFESFFSERDARVVAEKINELAKTLTEAARSEHGKMCLQQMKWLDERFLDADFLPENDGPSTYSVVVGENLPEERRGCRHYE